VIDLELVRVCQRVQDLEPGLSGCANRLGTAEFVSGLELEAEDRSLNSQ